MRSLLAPLMVTLVLAALCSCEKDFLGKRGELDAASGIQLQSGAEEDSTQLLSVRLPDPKDPSGSPSAASIKITKEVANAFVKRQKRSSLYEWYSEHYKNPMEQMHERCENYPPCDYLSDQIGFSMAYNHFFRRY
ncbi:osteocalcin-like isoform X1 [Buteo buteo]|uniref:osteocalcin-like isoform X1 n=1 Tax=Buteo buteo TaxID=30397 RepID=UPI003EBB4DD7